MKFKKEQQQNYFTVVGNISEIDVQDGVNNTGVPYIRGVIVVEAGDSEFKVDFYEGKMWKVGKPDERPNPRFEEIKELTVGETVKFSCALEENKFAVQNGDIISNERLSLNFINKPTQADEHGLTFDMVGVVLKPLQEVLDKDSGDITGYAIKLGQAQYHAPNKPDKGFSIVELAVDPKQTAAVNYISQEYKLGDTVRVSGRGKAMIETTTKTTESLFGEPIVETFQDYTTNYFIESGLQANETMKYSEEEIEFLTQATKDNEVELKSTAASKTKKTGAAAFGAKETSTPAGGSNSGIGGLLGL